MEPNVDKADPAPQMGLRGSQRTGVARARAARAALCSIGEDSAVAPEGTEAESPRP